MAAMKIMVQQGKGGWRWNVVASNGKVTANNETFPTRAHAVRAVKGVVMGILRRYWTCGRPPVAWTLTKINPTTYRLDFEYRAS